jgi:uncharacterized membrane protein
MRQFVRPRSRRADISITIAYVAFALALGRQGGVLAVVLGDAVSPMSSASAVAILSAIASGMMALTAIVFSLVLVAIQLGSASYSPRLLGVVGERPFLAHALGVLTGTFVYALMAIRTVDLGGAAGVNVSVVAIALVWLLASIIVLVLLLPRIRRLSIGAILAMLQRRGAAVAARSYPAHASSTVSASTPATAMVGAIEHVGRTQYIVGIDVPRLVRWATRADATIVIARAIGDSVCSGDRLATLHGEQRSFATREVRAAIWLADERSLDNDPSYTLRLLVDIAIRALSPAVNDPTTAVSVLDQIEGMLRLLGRRHLEADAVADAQGVVRVVRPVPSWDDLVALALTEIHQYGRESFQVERRLTVLLRDLPEALPAGRHAALARFAHWRADSVGSVLHEATGWLDPSASDRQGIGRREVRG